MRSIVAELLTRVGISRPKLPTLYPKIPVSSAPRPYERFAATSLENAIQPTLFPANDGGNTESHSSRYIAMAKRNTPSSAGKPPSSKGLATTRHNGTSGQQGIDPFIPAHEIRTIFSQALSDMYRKEMTLYNTLVEVTEQTNRQYRDQHPHAADLDGQSFTRLQQERHGAIRLGSPTEMRKVADFFAVMGMYPVGFYDFTTLPKPLPISSTAFRPIDPEELAKNPFRMFTSLMQWDNGKFFSPEVSKHAKEYCDSRELFSQETLEYIARFKQNGGLTAREAIDFVHGALKVFAMPAHPVPKSLYDAVKKEADIGADVIVGTQLNHLTPPTLDIDDSRKKMLDLKIPMLEETQGPNPKGIRVQLRQDSFIAPKLQVKFQLDDGSTVDGTHTAQFGEMEQRGIALTPEGKKALAAKALPETYAALEQHGLAYFTYTPSEKGLQAKADRTAMPDTLRELVDQGYVKATGITYEDFLAQNARNIFTSTVADSVLRTGASGVGKVERSSREALSTIIGRDIIDPDTLYAAQQARSIQACYKQLRKDMPETLKVPVTSALRQDPKEVRQMAR